MMGGMAKQKVQFGTKAFLGVVSLAAIAMGAMRQAVEAMNPLSGSVIRFAIAVCLMCGCCFGISGFVVGWPVRGFLFGLIVVPVALYAAGWIVVSIVGP